MKRARGKRQDRTDTLDPEPGEVVHQLALVGTGREAARAGSRAAREASGNEPEQLHGCRCQAPLGMSERMTPVLAGSGPSGDETITAPAASTWTDALPLAPRASWAV